MEFKKPQTIIVIFLLLWVVFIGWGIVKTTFQLSKQKTLLKKSPSGQPGISEVVVQEMGQKREAVPILVRVFKVQRTDFSDLLPVMGTVKGKTEIDFKFEINGLIKSILFREGEMVKKGDLVACLNPKDAQLRVQYTNNKRASARAAYQSGLKKLEVHQKLYEAGAIIKSRLEEVELECESAKYELETTKSEEKLAESELEKTNLYAPINGVLGPREAEEGEFVTPQDKVVSLLEIENVLIEVGIVERDINKIKLGQLAKTFVDAYPDMIFEGEVDNIYPIVEGKTRTLTAKIKVSNPKGLLLPGMFCRAEITVVELKGALIIPSVSLIPTGQETTMVPVIPGQSLQVGEDEMKTGVTELRQVTVGYMTTDYAQITEGLNEGDLVIIEAQGELQDRAKVRISAIEEISS